MGSQMELLHLTWVTLKSQSHIIQILKACTAFCKPSELGHAMLLATEN